ncbi:MAG: hypothetical protein QM775_21110 [Pirellulales bacterium]
MNAQEAKDYGLVDEVLLKPPVDPDAEDKD